MHQLHVAIIAIGLMLATIAAAADEPLGDPTTPNLGWTLWGDGGDRALAVTTVDGVAPDGRRCLRVEVTMDPANGAWPALGFEVPRELVTEQQVHMLEVRVHAPADIPPLPPGTVTAQLYQRTSPVGGLGSLPELVPGGWSALRVGLRGLSDVETTPARIKLAFRPEGEVRTVVFHIEGPFVSADTGGYAPYEKLKELHIATPVVTEDRQPIAAIVTPGERYADAVTAIQQAIRAAAGVELPVIGADADPHEVLAQRPVIALGNMATSGFLHELYREGYTWLDLRYPGPGGSVVRSLHNPYASGHNVILVGGSDDGGVLKAAERLGGLLGKGPGVTLGRLMEIQLGEGMTPPEIGETIYGWHNSFRVLADGREVGAPPDGVFGWNPISMQAALYYMTGQEKYLREFVRLALPDPDNVPEEVRTSSAFYNMEHPLVENYHYYAHNMPLIWDLIEESELLDDETRLRITNELRAQQDYYDAADTWAPRGTDRHGCYNTLTIFTGSRYFARYYPAQRWQTRLQNVRTAFSWWLEHATWGERDTLGWVNTSIGPVLEYWHIADPEAYVNSGLARTMMSSQEILWSGKDYEESNRSQALNLMHRATWLLRDGRYTWLSRQAGFDLDKFRIGQSWWPSPEIEIAPPTDLIGRVSVMPLSEPWAKLAGADFPAEEGYQFLSYRTGLGPDDGYFLLDGNDACGRNPHHISALKSLRMTNRTICDGYENMVTVLRNGMSENRVARAARLEGSVALDGLAWVRSTVPNEAFSSWQRDILWVDDSYVLVADTVTARESGEFEVACRWRPVGAGRLGPEGVFGGQHSSGVNATFVCAQPALVSIDTGILTQQRNVQLAEGDTLGFVNILYADAQQGQFGYRMLPVGETAAVFSGTRRGLLCVGPFKDEEAGITVEADLALVTEQTVALMNATRFTTTAGEITSAQPVSLVWRLDEGRLTVDGGQEPALPDTGAFAAAIGAALQKLIEATPAPEAPSAPQVSEIEQWAPAREMQIEGAITHIAMTGEQTQSLWVATDAPALHVFAPDQATPLRTIELPKSLNALVSVPGSIGGVAAVGGGDDDMLRAWDAGGELLWERPSHVSETFRVGDRWEAPWFTDPVQKPGILSLMVADVTGTGKPEVVVGRPSTVEYWSLPEGELLARVPIHWGDVRELALLRHADGPQVLAGKHVTGNSRASVLDANREIITEGAFGAIIAGATDMHAWLQRGIGALQVADLDADGAEDVVVAHTGHWNDLRAFSAGGTQVLWQHSFGAARPSSHFIEDMLVADIDGDGGCETVVGMQNGWLVCIEASGEVRWSRRLSGGVRTIAGLPEGVVVGLADGHVLAVTSAGEPHRAIKLGGAVSALTTWPAGPDVQMVLAGGADGRLVVLPR